MGAVHADSELLPYLAELEPGRSGPLLASLPHLWLALILTVYFLDGLAFRSLPPGALTSAGDVLSVALLAACVIVRVYSWKIEAYLWTAAWGGYVLWLLAFVVGNILYLLDAENWAASVGFQVLALLAIGIAYWVHSRFSPLLALEGALALLPTGAVTLLRAWAGPGALGLLDTLFAVSVCVMASVAAAGTLISMSRRLGLALTVGACLLIGLFRMGLHLTQYGYPGGPAPDGLAETLRGLAVMLAISLIFYLGPVVFWRVWESLMLRLTRSPMRSPA